MSTLASVPLTQKMLTPDDQGYALVEYETMAEAQAAIDGASGTTLLEQTLQCDFAFVRPPPTGPKKGRGREGRGRSASPSRRRGGD